MGEKSTIKMHPFACYIDVYTNVYFVCGHPCGYAPYDTTISDGLSLFYTLPTRLDRPANEAWGPAHFYCPSVGYVTRYQHAGLVYFLNVGSGSGTQV